MLYNGCFTYCIRAVAIRTFTRNGTRSFFTESNAVRRRRNVSRSVNTVLDVVYDFIYSAKNDNVSRSVKHRRDSIRSAVYIDEITAFTKRIRAANIPIRTVHFTINFVNCNVRAKFSVPKRVFFGFYECVEQTAFFNRNTSAFVIPFGFRLGLCVIPMAVITRYTVVSLGIPEPGYLRSSALCIRSLPYVSLHSSSLSISIIFAASSSCFQGLLRFFRYS